MTSKKTIKAEVLWMGYSRKTGDALPWVWGASRRLCFDHAYGWVESEYIRRKVRIVPIKSRKKNKARRGGKRK